MKPGRDVMAIYSSIGIRGAVGKRGQNIVTDVSTVQKRLNELMDSSRVRLKVDGRSGRLTEGMIKDFQSAVCRFNTPDGRVDPAGKTITAMNSSASEQKWKASPARGSSGRKKQRINLHFRSISLTDVSFDKQLSGAEKVYGAHGISLVFKSGESVQMSVEEMKKFKRVNTSCLAKADEWQTLQKALVNVPKSDICVVFVGSLWDSTEKPGDEMFLGCGAYRPGSPACAIAANASEYDMAHEIGHVLGLSHDNSTGNLMHPTQDTYPKLPVLTKTQVEKILKSPLCV